MSPTGSSRASAWRGVSRTAARAISCVLVAAAAAACDTDGSTPVGPTARASTPSLDVVATTAVPIIDAGDWFTCGLTPAGDAVCWGDDLGFFPMSQTGPFTDVRVGVAHVCALTPAGAAECWGTPPQGEDQAGPFVEIAVGDEHSCGLGDDGSIDCWGANLWGQSDDQVGPYTAVTAAGYASCGLTEAGAADCWGVSTIVDQTGPYLQLSGGGSHVCGLTPTGAADCWGDNANGQAEDQAGPFSKIAAGSNHTCALTPSGAVDCWGLNDYGQAEDRPGPYVDVTAGRWHTCAVTAAGVVECWGRDEAGRLDVPNLSGEPIPFEIDLKPGSAVNPISLKGKGDARIAVAILSSPDFDATTQVDVSTVTLGDGSGAETPVATQKKGAYQTDRLDVNADGRMDLVLYFNRATLVTNGDLSMSTTQLVLRASLTNGDDVEDTEVVTVRP